MSVANSYARALYEAAKEAQVSRATIELLEQQLDQLIAIFDASKEAEVVLLGPLTTFSEKKAFLDELAGKLGSNPLLVQFIVLLLKKGRLQLLREIRDAFHVVWLASEGGLAGTVMAAEPIGDSDLNVLTRTFSEKLGKKVSFKVAVDPTLMAGLKVTISGVSYDGTLRSQLDKLRDQIATGIAGTYS